MAHLLAETTWWRRRRCRKRRRRRSSADRSDKRTRVDKVRSSQTAYLKGSINKFRSIQVGFWEATNIIQVCAAVAELPWGLVVRMSETEQDSSSKPITRLPVLVCDASRSGCYRRPFGSTLVRLREMEKVRGVSRMWAVLSHDRDHVHQPVEWRASHFQRKDKESLVFR